jgi:hypothetical protein
LRQDSIPLPVLIYSSKESAFKMIPLWSSMPCAEMIRNYWSIIYKLNFLIKSLGSMKISKYMRKIFYSKKNLMKNKKSSIRSMKHGSSSTESGNLVKRVKIWASGRKKKMMKNKNKRKIRKSQKNPYFQKVLQIKLKYQRRKCSLLGDCILIFQRLYILNAGKVCSLPLIII